jgi:hypothetical protein
MSTRVQEVFSLSAWYHDVLKRHEQLAAWTAGSVGVPHSVWLSGLFNPKAFLTAVGDARRPGGKVCAGWQFFLWQFQLKQCCLRAP